MCQKTFPGQVRAKSAQKEGHEKATEKPRKSKNVMSLSGPISRDTAILSLRYPISRDTFSGRLALPQNGAIPPPPWYLVSHRHICAIPHFATYRAIIVRYPIKTSTKEFCDTIATSIARYEKYRCWASYQAVSNRRFANKRFSQLNDERCWHVRERSPSKCCNLPVSAGTAFCGGHRQKERSHLDGERSRTCQHLSSFNCENRLLTNRLLDTA